MASKKSIVIFQQDLRLQDNPALTHAAERGEVVAIYVLDDDVPEPYRMGSASKWWLRHSLVQLQASFLQHGVRLLLRRGNPLSVIKTLIEESKADAVYWNRHYDPYSIKQNEKLQIELEKSLVEVQTFKGTLLFEPKEITNKQGSYFKVFTPFWKHCIQKNGIGEPLEIPKLLPSTGTYSSDHIDTWKLLPTSPNWAKGIEKAWQPGEEGAHQRFNSFLTKHLNTYPDGRNIPSADGTSYLSPHLHFGEISPRQIWHSARHHEMRTGDTHAAEKFLSELGWREFSYHLLYHIPSLPEKPFNPKFEHFQWAENSELLNAWQRGKTGYPIVDAGMRELWHTGYMHNRVRMIVASFLTKDLQISWQQGAAWFWDTLVDADIANNSASWQWVAGCGADASPYYRVFNPVLQGNKFDPKGEYIRRWLPELAHIPNQCMHSPWEMTSSPLYETQNYPRPIVNHESARQTALERYRALKNYS